MKKTKAVVTDDAFLVTFDDKVSAILEESLLDNTTSVAPPPEVLKIFYCSRTVSLVCNKDSILKYLNSCVKSARLTLMFPWSRSDLAQTCVSMRMSLG
jgi:hypothetical protein